jgi:hypothetical protein
MIFLLLGFGSVRFLIRVPALPDSSLIRRWRTECPSLVSSMAACEERLFFCSFEPTHVLSQCLKRAPIFGSAVRLWFHHRQSTCCHFPITRARFHASCGLIRVRRTRWVRLQLLELVPAVLGLGFSFPRLLATLFGFQFCRSSQAAPVLSAVSPGDSVALHFNFSSVPSAAQGLNSCARWSNSSSWQCSARQGAAGQSWWLSFS